MKLTQVILIICFGFFDIVGKGNAEGNYFNQNYVLPNQFSTKIDINRNDIADTCRNIGFNKRVSDIRYA